MYSVTTKDKTNRVIQIEQNVFRNKSAERLLIEEMWDELVGPATTASIVDGEKHSGTVLEHILLHLWSVRESKDRQENPNSRTNSKPDYSELETIEHRAGWGCFESQGDYKGQC